MKRVKIFLASSITDLRFDRIEVGNFFRQMNDIYVDSGVYFDLVMCEDYDNTIAAEGKQSQFDAEIRESELVFFLFFKRVGDYTRHEFEVAIEEYRRIGKPKILTYFKYVDSPENAEAEVLAFMNKLDSEVKHYYNVYNCIDTLKLGVFMQIKMMRLDESEIKLSNGKLLIGDREIADTATIPLFSGNERLCTVREELERIKSEYVALKAQLLEDGSDEAYIRFGEIASKKSELESECRRLEESILNTAESIARETSGESNLSDKQRAAYRFMQRGLWREALEILDASEILSELSHNESLSKGLSSRIETNVAELLQRIEVLRSVGLNPESVKEVYSLYATVYEATLRHHLSTKPLLEYAKFLHDQNDIEKCLAVAQKLAYLFADPDAEIDMRDRAKLAHYTGMFFTNAKRYEEAENSLKEAIRFYDALPDATDRDRLEATRALNVLANTYFFRGAYSKMLETDRTAKDRFEQLYRQNPSDPDFMGAYAMSLDNFGIALEKEAKYEESIGYHLKGLELYRTLAESHPVDYRLRYARCHHNTACGYELIADYVQAEMHFKEAIRIREEERLLNPTAVEPLLSGSYWCLGNLYRRTFKYKKTVEPYTTAYRMRAVMRRRSPVYSPELYTIYEELKNIYVQMNMTEERISLTYEYAMFLSTIDDRTDSESHRVVGYVTEISRELIAAQRAKEALSLLQKATAAKLPDPFAVFSFLSLTVTACNALGKHETANLYRKKLNLENGTKEKMPQ